MSLRIFHVVFIVVSVALTLYLVGWGIREFMLSHSTLGISMAVLGLVGGALLIWYGIRVFHKLKDLP
jgi:small neutral amino acid transporter SnatA (MarC family)